MVESTIVPFFRMRPRCHKRGDHLGKQLFLQSVLDQQIAETAKGIAVRNLIAGIDTAEIRKCTTVRLLLLRLPHRSGRTDFAADTAAA